MVDPARHDANGLMEIAAHHRMTVPLRIFTGRRLVPAAETIAALKQIAELDVLAEPVIGLPDLHHKPRLECPSSVATATREHIVLGLSSPSPNCGMALARTTVHEGDLDDDALDALLGELAQRLNPARERPVLSPEQVADVMLRGAEAAIERYDLAPSALDFMDQRGNALPEGVDAQVVLGAVPQSLWAIGGHYFGLVGRGNHFLEVQVVEEILDAATARAWGLEKGQIAVMYHADSGHLGAFVGRIYAHRRKNSLRGRLWEWRVKLPFHLKTGTFARVFHRAFYHILPRRLSPIEASSEEGRRALLALGAASNYAYANRLAVLAALRDAMQAVCDVNLPAPSLLWDAPHNSIRRERVNGIDLWLHRHNAACALPPSQIAKGSPFARTGQPMLLPGTERTSSYLCAVGEGAARTLHSVDHGAGRSALKLGRPLRDGAATRLYTYDTGQTELRPHLSDDGLDEVLAVLQTHDIARPVVRLRPMAVLKAKKADP